MDNTIDRILRVARDCLGIIDAGDKSSDFMDDLGADSLDFIEIIVRLEEEFNVEISDALREKIHTVSDAAEIIEKLCLTRKQN